MYQNYLQNELFNLINKIIIILIIIRIIKFFPQNKMTNLINNNSFGLFIPNSNFNFKVEWIKNIEDYLFVNSANEELIIFKIEKEELVKKYILLTKSQNRDNTIDVFIVNLLPNLIVCKA